MAIEFDNKLKKTEMTTASAAPAVDVGSTSASSKPIDFKTSNPEQEKANAEFVNYINTDEFKNLSPENQLKQLKERFFPNSSAVEIQQYVTAAREAIQARSTVQTSQTETQSESNSAEFSNPDTASTKTSDIESAIEKAGLKGTIDEVKYQLLKKEKDGQISSIEKGILDQLRNTDTAKEPSSTASKELVSSKTIVSDEFQNKTPKEQLSFLTDTYLSKNDKEYAGLSDEKKQEYVNKQMNDIMKAINPDGRKLSSAEQKAAYLDAAVLLQLAHSSGKSVKDFQNMKPEDLKKAINDAKMDQLEQFLSKIPAEALKDKTPEEKIKVCVDFALTKMDDKYNKLDDAEKEKYLNSKLDDFIENKMGFKGWKTLDPEKKEKLFEAGANILYKKALSYKVTGGDPNVDVKTCCAAMNEALEKSGGKGCEDIIANNKIIMALCDSLGIENPTEQDVYNKLLELEKQGNLTEDQKKILETFKIEKRMGIDLGSQKARAETNRGRAALIGGDVQALFESGLNGLKADNVVEYKETIDNYVAGAIQDGDINQIKALSQIMKSKGLSAKEIKGLLGQAYNRLQARGLAWNDGKLVAASVQEAMQTGDKNAREASAVAVRLSSQYLDEPELTTVGETAVKYEPLIKPFTESINDRNYITKESAAQVSASILTSENVPNANKATFTKEFIASSAVNGAEEQLYFGRELSKIDNPAVTEGLAAASNSVDTSVRQQYNSYVETAAKNYPPEQQTAIKTAMQTGEISEQTLSQKTVSTSDKNDSQTGQTSAAADTVKNSSEKNNSVSQNRTTTSASPAASASKVNASQNIKTKTSQNVKTAQETQILQQKKEALLDKIVSYEKAKAERTMEREQAKIEAQSSPTPSSESKKIDKEVSAEIPESENVNKQEAVAQTDEDIELTQDEQDTLTAVITDIFSKNSVSAAYEKLITKLGESGKDKFIEIFASKGKEGDIRSFAQNYKGNTETIIKLIDFCKSDSLKLDLVRLLPSNKVNELISSRKISSTNIAKLVKENKVDPKIFLDYLKNNKGALSADQIKDFLKDMPLAYRGEFMALLQSIPGSDEWIEAQQQNMKTNTSSEPHVMDNSTFARGDLPTLEDGLPVGSNKVAMRGQYDKMKKNGPFYMNA